MKDKSIYPLFIAVPFMGRIMETVPGFSRNNKVSNTYGGTLAGAGQFFIQKQVY
ncbi:hypothetical protein SAMN05421821_102225 [Mucilaginibacter lappiensis]|uniref:Uncharacterized protein n=1 Tax=Mucilaginibacter lappiensis TaxID=354630 RepID=A0ABR6PG15_9SPHI|nr:hypothetical protein [Mucilaginibacter lappiensis]SIQ34110.1 hypothetical protein SAMN05421821_102225 [Mucilaginibacter lappiensis]